MTWLKRLNANTRRELRNPEMFWSVLMLIAGVAMFGTAGGIICVVGSILVSAIGRVRMAVTESKDKP